jgi:hypothetical protein
MRPAGTDGPAATMPGEFEQHARALLEESVLRVDSRVRSRLNQARHAAIDEAFGRRRSLLRRFHLMPAATAVAAAVLVALLVWPRIHPGDGAQGGHASVEDLDLIADSEALDLVSDETDGGAFYEWAVEQADPNESGSAGA